MNMPIVANPFDADKHTVPESAVAWGAIVAGGAAAAALSLILLVLGTGLGLSAVSPWAPDGISAKTFGVSTILWLTATQVLASGLGGYLAGRLRSAWRDQQADEVYFRDSAHGLLAWAVASLATAALLTSAIGGILGSTVRAGAAVAGGASSSLIASVPGNPAAAGLDYAVDALFRVDAKATDAAAAAPPATLEASRIFMNTLRTGALPPEDVRYLGERVAARSGLTQPEAEKRVTEVYTRLQAKARTTETEAREAADKARKTSAYGALWLFISLLTGAFVASVTAIFGGRQRDL